MRAGTAVSVIAHGALVAWGLLSLAAHRLDAPRIEAIPVTLASVADVTSVPKATPPAPDPPAPMRTPPLPPPPAPAAATPPPAAPPAPVPTPTATADAKPPVPPPPSPPQPATPDASSDGPATVASVPAPAPAAKPRAAAAAKPATGPDRPFFFDRIGALLNGTPPAPQRSPPPRPAATAAAAATTPKPQPQPQPKPDALALGSLIATTSADAHLTLSEVDALRARIAACWTPPAGWTDPAEVRVVLIIALAPDGSVAGQPQVVDVPPGRYAQTAPESAVRAVRACAPYVLPPEKYPDWKEVKITFDPRAMGA